MQTEWRLTGDIVPGRRRLTQLPDRASHDEPVTRHGSDFEGDGLGRRRTELGSPHSMDSAGLMAFATGEAVFEGDGGSSASCVPAKRHGWWWEQIGGGGGE